MSFLLTVYKDFIFQCSDLNHTCPLGGLIYFKSDNISLQYLAFPQIVPVCEYRLELNIYRGDRKTIVGGATIHGNVSHHTELE